MPALQYFQNYSLPNYPITQLPNYAVKVMCHLQDVMPVEYWEQIELMIFNALIAEEKQN